MKKVITYVCFLDESIAKNKDEGEVMMHPEQLD
jgi:hypothetical protein